MENFFFKDENIPYFELRVTKNSALNYKEHFHIDFSIGALIDGITELGFKNKKYILNKNELAVFNPYELHACNPINRQKRSYFMLYVNNVWLWNLQKAVFKNVKNFTPIKNPIIKNKNLYVKFIQMCEKIAKSKVLSLEKEEIIEDFFVILFFQSIRKDIKTPEVENLQKAKEYIIQNFNKNITVNDIAKQCKLSPFYFSRRFKKNFGISPHQFLMNIRIEKAKKMLKKKSVIEVAYEAGFYDQSHFNNSFKQYTAITPLEYKKMFC